jgi:hypothetical protein
MKIQANKKAKNCPVQAILKIKILIRQIQKITIFVWISLGSLLGLAFEKLITSYSSSLIN